LLSVCSRIDYAPLTLDIWAANTNIATVARLLLQDRHASDARSARRVARYRRKDGTRVASRRWLANCSLTLSNSTNAKNKQKTNKQKKKQFNYIIDSEDLQADQWKIYPCEVTPWTQIKKWYKYLFLLKCCILTQNRRNNECTTRYDEGTYKPYANTICERTRPDGT
jgi:hypothetical protein